MSSDERPGRPADQTPADPTLAETVPDESASGTGAPSGASPSAAPVTSPVQDAPATSPVPDAATLESIATPASLRRAPRIGMFITTGVLLGVVVGWLLAVLGSGTSGEARTGAILLTAGGLGALGAVVGSGLAALADRRSVRSRPTPPRR